MDVQIDHAALKGVKLFLGCPMVDGRCHAEFAYALARLAALCTHWGIELELYFVSGEPLVMQARNRIADRFLQGEAAHLMLIDADIDFQPIDVVTMLAMQRHNLEHSPYDVLCAAYPLKRIAWDKVAQAAQQGLGDADPAALQRYASAIRVTPVANGRFDISRPVEVSQAGTGFMMIRRAALDTFVAHYPHRRYLATEPGSGPGEPRAITQFFDTAIDGGAETLEDDLRTFLGANPGADHGAIRRFLAERSADAQAYVSEDYMFCRLLRRSGGKSWADLWRGSGRV